MTREILPLLLAIPLPAFWVVFATPLLYRLFGVSVPWNPRKRRNVKLTFNQRVLLDGVLSFGVAAFLFRMGDVYLRWWLYRGPSDAPTFERSVDAFFICLIAGVLLGLVGGLTEGRRTTD